MGKKTSLPLFDGDRARTEPVRPAKKPSLDDARARLGGTMRGASSPPDGVFPGRVVRVRSASSDEPRVAVVVFANDREAHALLDGSRLVRLDHDALEPFEGAAPIELARIAYDAQVFGGLTEGQAVRYADASSDLLVGKLVEKCRYGALIVRDDGTVVAVGFRKLWPATSAGAS